MFRRRFRSRRRFRGGFARRVRAVTGITLTKRVLLAGLSIPDVTSVDWDNPLIVDLLQCIEAQDEEQVSDGTIIADAPLYSRALSMRLNLTILGSTSTTNVYRWLVYKKPDGESLVTSLAGTGQFHNSGDTPTLREVRKLTVAKGMVVTNPSTAVTKMNIFVRKAAWRRISPLRENDTISLLIAKDAAGTTSLLHGMGNIYVRANG